MLGYAHFMGMELTVTPAVLIPRPETAQLVDMITDTYGSRQNLSVKDIGTGSGCIAIALARALTRLRTLRDRAIDRTDDPICLDFVERYDDLEAALRTLAFIREVTVDGDGDSRVYDVDGVVWPIVETIASTPVPDKDELAATLKTTMSALEDLERPELVSGLPASAMVSVASVHQQIASLLSDAGMDENFWRGIRLG